MSPNVRKPRSGSLQFWPRKRAKRAYARVRSWSVLNETRLQGFIGYKAGMTHIMVKDNTQNSLTKNDVISLPVSIVECPSIKPFSIRFYKFNDNQEKQIISEVFAKNTNKELIRKISLSKKQGKEPKDFDDIKITVYTQPKLAGFGKKKPDMLEFAISGPKEKKLELAKKLLEQPEIKLQDVFKENQLLDVSAVTKGKGFQGVVKRYGISILQHKSEDKKRGIGNLGPRGPGRIRYTIAQPGKMGYHQRMEYNKQILKIGTDPKEVNPVCGFLHYGLVKNSFLLIKGSIPGPAKRTVVMTLPRRPGNVQNLEITKISTSSKQ